VVKVSSETSEGLDLLKKTIEETALSLEERKESPLFRLPVDRSFSVTGFGTVVTGTIFSGAAVKGEKVVILPSDLSAEIRGVEVHKSKVDKAFTGQRAALNLSGVSKDEIKRGDVVCAPGYFIPSMMADCSLELLNRSGPLKQGERVKFHLGTSETDGRVYTLADKSLVQIRLSDEVVMVRGDRFILRNQEATKTLGGGVVLDAHPQKHKRRKSVDPQSLQSLSEAGLRQQVLLELGKTRSVRAAAEFCALLTARRKNVQDALLQLSGEGKVRLFKTATETYALASEKYRALTEALKTWVRDYHDAHPLLNTGAGKPEAAQKCAQVLGEKETETVFAQLWEQLTHDPGFKEVDGTLALNDWEVKSTDEDAKLSESIRQIFDKAGFAPPDKLETLKATGRKRAFPVFDALVKAGRLVCIEEQYFSDLTLESGAEMLKAYLVKNKSGTVSDLRQVLNTSRKYAIPLLNYYEAKGLLVRQGDLRILA